MKNKIYLITTKIITILWVGLVLLSPKLAILIAQRNRFFFVKFVILIFLVMFVDQYMAFIMENLPRIKKLFGRISFERSIDGIPCTRLLSFLMEYDGMPTNEFIAKFGLSKESTKILGDNLERVGILERGAKNARVLSRVYDPEKILGILQNSSDSSTLSIPLVNISPTSYVFANSGLVSQEN